MISESVASPCRRWTSEPPHGPRPRGREPSAARDSCPLKASCARESNFALFGKPRGIAQRLENVFTLQIRIVRQQLLDGMASTDLSHDHPDCDTHAADARFSAHHGGIPSDAIQLRHRRLPSKCCLALRIACPVLAIPTSCSQGLPRFRKRPLRNLKVKNGPYTTLAESLMLLP